ncbi:hypothetical protein Tco_0846847 [Tanacetum coccineum]
MDNMLLLYDLLLHVECDIGVIVYSCRQDLGFIPSGNVVLSSTYVGKILGADQLLVILCYRYQESGIGYWILSMTINGAGDADHKTLIATYDIPLDLRPRLLDSNFRMINLPAGDTAIGIYSRIFNSSGVRIPFSSFLLAVLKYFKWKEKIFLIDRRAIPFHMPWRHPDSRITDKGVLVQSGLSRVWRNPMCDPVLRRSDNTGKGRDGSEFSMEDIGNLNDVSQGEHINVIPLRTFDPSLGLDVSYPPILLPDKEVKTHAELSGGARRITRASSHASHGVSEDASSLAQEAVAAPDTQPLDTDAGADEIASDGNVDPYYEARVSNTAEDVFERDLFPFVPGPYYIPYPYEEGSGIELSDRMSVLQCQLITHGSMLNDCYDHSLRNVEHLSKQCAQQTQTIKKQRADLKQQSESTVRANEEVSRKYRNERDALALKKEKIKEELVGTKSQLEYRVRKANEIQDSIASFFQSDFTPLVQKFLKSGEFHQAFAGVLNTTISVGVERGLQKFDRVITAFPDTTFPFLDKVSQHSQSSLQDIARLEPDRVTSSHQPSSATAYLRANTYMRHSTSSSETFGHTSTPKHLKKKKKSVEKKGPSAA